MVGGKPEVFEESKVFLSAMGKNMVHVGGAGSGGVTKICNNLGLAISMVGTAEAMNLVSLSFSLFVSWSAILGTETRDGS
jgi:3-hydroxyisobutyrate dehydrogenase-like beta-hydroxyacid dehydrogenase